MFWPPGVPASSLAKISCYNVSKSHHKNHVCSTPKVNVKPQQCSLKFIFDVEIQKTHLILCALHT